jgi:uncharacterized membrane protein
MRRSRGPVRHLEWRIRLFGVGAILAVVGMATGQGWLVNLAIAVLLLGMVLRFAPARGEHTGEGDDPELH